MGRAIDFEQAVVNWYAGMHWSYNARAWLGFFAVGPDQRAVLRFELTWFKKTPDVAAAEILAFMKAKGITRLIDCVAQPEIFPKNDKARGETVSETFRSKGIAMTPGDKDTLNGWARIRSWLAVRTFVDEAREIPLTFDAPSLTIHEDCPYFLDTFLTLVADKDHPDEIEETTDMFPANGLRYFVMARPLPPTTIIKTLPPDAIGHEIEAIRRGLRFAHR